MAISHAGVLPAPTTHTCRSRLLGWIAGGVLAAAVVAVTAVATWPTSETDKARADGKAYGTAVVALADARSGDEVRAALADVHNALADTREHAGDALAAQVADQTDALDRVLDGFVGASTTDDGFTEDVYRAQLDVATNDLATQADDFRTTGSDVRQAFWDGYADATEGE
jgi:hypothetical protein